MTRVRFAPSPTGTLHVGNALSAVANRRLGDYLLLRIDDTDPARNVPGGEEAIEADLGWLGVAWDEGPVRQSDRAERHLAAARAAGLEQVFQGVPLWRSDGTPTFHLASVVDDIDFGITDVDPRLGSPPERAAARRSASRARFGAAEGHPPRPGGRRRRQEAVEAGRRRHRRRPARRRLSGRGGARLPRGARPAPARRAVRPRPHSLALGGRAFRAHRRGACGPGRRAARGGVARCAVPTISSRRARLADTVLVPPATVEASRSPHTLERFVELRVPLPEALSSRAGEERDP